MSSPSPTTPTPDDTAPAERRSARRRRSFLQRLPWEKIVIWGLFILAVYALRDFFFIIFMTFIVAYIMRGCVRVSRMISPNAERLWLQRLLAIGFFIGLLGAFYGVGLFFVPQLYDQGKTLVTKVTSVQQQPDAILNDTLRDTVGRYLFFEEYGNPGDGRYTEAYETYQAKGLHYEEYDRFQQQQRLIHEQFRKSAADKLAIAALAAIDAKNPQERDRLLRQWLQATHAPQVFEQNPEKHIEAWEAKYTQEQTVLGLPPLQELRQRDDYDQFVRDKALLALTTRMLDDAVRRPEYEQLWRRSVGALALAMLRANDPERYDALYREFYEQHRSKDSDPLPYDFEQFRALAASYQDAPTPEDKVAAFSEKLKELRPADADDADQADHSREGFEKLARQQLLNEWKQQSLAQNIGAKAEQLALTGLENFGRHLTIVGKLLVLPVEMALSLLLAFFITFDVPKLKKGINRLKESRVQHFYDEIAPGLISFGRLIGRAFFAQGIIAVCNTILTFGAMVMLGVDNEYFLSAIVFVCSFIPVLGVVLSSVPIAITALVQDDGGIGLALASVVAVLVIHFIEASILNPKILGDIMHLHPVLVLAILAVGEHFFGVWGLLLGVPVTVYIIRFVILDEGIPGIIEPIRRRPPPVENAPPEEPARRGEIAAEPG